MIDTSPKMPEIGKLPNYAFDPNDDIRLGTPKHSIESENAPKSGKVRILLKVDMKGRK